MSDENNPNKVFANVDKLPWQSLGDPLVYLLERIQLEGLDWLTEDNQKLVRDIAIAVVDRELS